MLKIPQVAKNTLIKAIGDVRAFCHEEKEKNPYKIPQRGVADVSDDLFANDASRQCIRALATSQSDIIMVVNLTSFGATSSPSHTNPGEPQHA